MIPYDQAHTAMLTDLEHLRSSLWARARRYQMQIDAFHTANQPPPPPPPELAGRIRVTGGIVEFINPTDAHIPTAGIPADN